MECNDKRWISSWVWPNSITEPVWVGCRGPVRRKSGECKLKWNIVEAFGFWSGKCACYMQANRSGTYQLCWTIRGWRWTTFSPLPRSSTSLNHEICLPSDWASVPPLSCWARKGKKRDLLIIAAPSAGRRTPCFRKKRASERRLLFVSFVGFFLFSLSHYLFSLRLLARGLRSLLWKGARGVVHPFASIYAQRTLWLEMR